MKVFLLKIMNESHKHLVSSIFLQKERFAIVDNSKKLLLVTRVVKNM